MQTHTILTDADGLLIMFRQGERGCLSPLHGSHMLQGLTLGVWVGPFSAGAGEGVAVGQVVVLCILCGCFPAGGPAGQHALQRLWSDLGNLYNTHQIHFTTFTCALCSQMRHKTRHFTEVSWSSVHITLETRMKNCSFAACSNMHITGAESTVCNGLRNLQCSHAIKSADAYLLA